MICIIHRFITLTIFFILSTIFSLIFIILGIISFIIFYIIFSIFCIILTIFLVISIIFLIMFTILVPICIMLLSSLSSPLSLCHHLSSPFVTLYQFLSQGYHLFITFITFVSLPCISPQNVGYLGLRQTLNHMAASLMKIALSGIHASHK